MCTKFDKVKDVHRWYDKQFEIISKSAFVDEVKNIKICELEDKFVKYCREIRENEQSATYANN